MSLRRTWLSCLAGLNFGPSVRSRRVAFRPPAIEALEDRKYLSATMTVLSDGHTLNIVGDSGDNRIDIVQDDRGVHVTADRGSLQNFTGIQAITVQTGYGNDEVRVIYGFNPQPDPPGDQSRSLDLRVSLGAGDDKFSADLQVPAGTIRLGVDAGTGNDSVTFRTVSDPTERPGGVIDPNVRNVLLYANLGDGNDVFNGEFQFPPDPCQVMVIGGGGADSINALIGLLSNATPAGNAQGTIDLSLNGGDGNDNIQSAIRNVNLNGRVTVDLQGGAGNDIVQQTLEMVKVNAGLDLKASGGIGDDYVVLSAASASGTTGRATPTLIANSAVRFNLQGDAGNDRLVGLLQPCITPVGTLDLIFGGGAGNDLFNLMLDLEAGDLNPPSDRDPASQQDGPIRLSALGGDGDDRLYLSVRNLARSKSLFNAVLDGGPGLDTALVTSGIDSKGWTN
ncbi:MAG TPA: hypothetical protein PLR25_18860 [Planctomycetaceae bacterium]|nr:hypothetical protein [Planctomycetaceae bacterium]